MHRTGNALSAHRTKAWGCATPLSRYPRKINPKSQRCKRCAPTLYANNLLIDQLTALNGRAQKASIFTGSVKRQVSISPRKITLKRNSTFHITDHGGTQCYITLKKHLPLDPNQKGSNPKFRSLAVTSDFPNSSVHKQFRETGTLPLTCLSGSLRQQSTKAPRKIICILIANNSDRSKTLFPRERLH